MFNKFRPQFYFFKSYLARIALVLTNRIKNYRPQITYIKKRDLFLSSLAGIAFHNFKILDEELEELNGCRDSLDDHYKHPNTADGWENIYMDESISVFRRKMPDRNVYEYRCMGSYRDISVEDFIRAQYDLEYRQKWDKNVVRLEVLEEDVSTGNQVIRWETRYSWLLQPRVYIYVRRIHYDKTNKHISVISRALDATSYPDSDGNSKSSTVRVEDYSSVLLVRPHTEVEKNGLDFVLQYYDDQKATVTNKIYEYSINYIGPRFLNDVHAAACKLASERKETESMENTTAAEETEAEEQQQTINCYA